MTLIQLLRETLRGSRFGYTEITYDPDGLVVVWFPEDRYGAVMSATINVVERETMLSHEGFADGETADRDAGLRFDWSDDAPNHRMSTRNPRAWGLHAYADAMSLSRGEARRAITGLHHKRSTATWRHDRMTANVIHHAPGFLPESETGLHRYSYYVE